MIEREFKWMLDKKSYDRMCLITQDIGLDGAERRVQVNYYYDTADMKYRKNGVTVRIRQEGELLRCTVKHRLKESEGGINFEEDYKTDTLPAHIKMRGDLLDFKGQLVTERRSVILSDGISLSLDKSLYLGAVDYEMELEYLKYAEETAEEWKRSFDRYIKRTGEVYASELPDGEGCLCKSERFFRRKEELCL